MPRKPFPSARPRKQDLHRPHKKAEVQNKIVCKKCGQDSGWTNSVLAHATGAMELKCKKCGEVCVKIMCKDKAGIPAVEPMKDLCSSCGGEKEDGLCFNCCANASK